MQHSINSLGGIRYVESLFIDSPSIGGRGIYEFLDFCIGDESGGVLSHAFRNNNMWAYRSTALRGGSLEVVYCELHLHAITDFYLICF